MNGGLTCRFYVVKTKAKTERERQSGGEREGERD